MQSSGASVVLEDSSLDEELVSASVVSTSVVMPSVVMVAVVSTLVVDMDVDVVDIEPAVVDAVVDIPPVALSPVPVPVCSGMHTPTEHTKGASHRLPVSHTQPLLPGVQSALMQTLASVAH